VLARLGRLPEAIADCEHAFAVLPRAPDGAPPAELAPSRLVLADNLAELHIRSRDHAGAERWQQVLADLERSFPDVQPYSPRRWSELHRAAGRLDQAIHHGSIGLAAGRAHLDPFAEEHYAADLGDLHYRRGDAATALRHFQAALAVRRRVGAPEDVLAGELSCALAALRADRLDEAELRFHRALALPACALPAARAEVLGALALVAARRGDGAGADALTNQAITLVVALGARDALARAARSAAEACLSLQRVAEARTMFARALELAATDGDPPLPDADWVGALLGLWRAGERDREGVLAALARMPRALGDPEAWWELPCLLDALAAVDLAAVELSAGDAGLAALRCVCDAAAQRRDCGAGLARLAAVAG
jgi:tetratricopeptide (TPR) repeat protein